MVSVRVLYAAVFRIGSVVFSIVEDTRAVAREIYMHVRWMWQLQKICSDTHSTHDL